MSIAEAASAMGAFALAKAEIARLQAELERERCELARTQGLLFASEENYAALQELYADRDQDLSYEYAARLAAEVLNDALDGLTAYAEHLDGCPAAAVAPSEPCCCGLDDAHIGVRRARAALAEANAQALAAARVMALGRAALAYEALRGQSVQGWTTETATAIATARAAYYAALRACQEV